MTTPTTMNTTRISKDYEWATICWQGWQATGVDGKPRECGEILIHSSYGSWANSWGHCGVPFDKFLQKTECSYVAEKFMGAKAYQFDGQVTVKCLRDRVIEWRRDSDLGKDQARAIWDWIEENEPELETSEESFVSTMSDGPSDCEYDTGNVRHFFEEPWERIRTSLNHQFAGFWRELWPVFINRITTTAP